MKKTKRFISIFLCLVLMLGCSIPAFAEGETSNEITRISCTVNGDPSSSRGFCWYTDEKSDSKIIICKNGTDITDSLKIEKARVSKWKNMFIHKVTVSGLESGTVYTYRVGSSNALSSEGSFKTDDLDKNLSFILFADVQSGVEENFKRSATALGKAFEIMPDPDFICNLGDFTDDCTNQEWDYYFKSFEQYNLSTTLVPVAGNHDGLFKWFWFNKLFSLDTSESQQNVNGVNYSFDWGNVHFTVLNTNDELSVSTAQMQWLESDLQRTDKDWKIVLMHKSIYTLGKDGRLPDAQYLKPALTPIFDRCGVDIVFSGHDHMYLRTKKLKDNKINESGTTYVLSGTMGSKRYSIRTYLAGTYLDTNHIEKLAIQNLDANYWNGSDWDSYDLNNVGACFNCITVDSDKLNLKSYIHRDKFVEENAKDHEELTPEYIEELNSNETVTCIDDFTITKRNEKPVYDEKVDPPVFTDYIKGFIPSIVHLAKFAIKIWLPNFLISLLKGQKYY